MICAPFSAASGAPCNELQLQLFLLQLLRLCCNRLSNRRPIKICACPLYWSKRPSFLVVVILISHIMLAKCYWRWLIQTNKDSSKDSSVEYFGWKKLHHKALRFMLLKSGCEIYCISFSRPISLETQMLLEYVTHICMPGILCRTFCYGLNYSAPVKIKIQLLILKRCFWLANIQLKPKLLEKREFSYEIYLVLRILLWRCKIRWAVRYTG